MWVKICGNTRLEDCLLAAELGADAVGFVFAPGKRTVTAAQVAGITMRLPPALEKIGVFTTQDADTIVAAAQEAGLTGVQLHSAPNRALLEQLAESTNFKLIQVLHWRTDVPVDNQREPFAARIEAVNTWQVVQALLVDSQTQTASGGTGTAFEWTSVAPLLRESRLPVIIAGGLRPETVASAIQVLTPWGVDVSSGVEHAPGIKDATAMASFIRESRL